MKRIVLLLMMLTVVMTQASGRRCRVCAGLGHAFGDSNITCRACNGSGRVSSSPQDEMNELRELEREAENDARFMEMNNLTPQELIAFQDLIRQAMTQVPVYQQCTACNNGRCRACGGYMNVSLDGPLCRVCGGSGLCPACRGTGQIQVGLQENPNKEMLIQRSIEILNQGRQRSQRGENAYGNRNSAGFAPSPGDGLFDTGDSPSGSGSSPLVYGLVGFLGVSLLGGLGAVSYLMFIRK